jgi:hypothetical protein
LVVCLENGTNGGLLLFALVEWLSAMGRLTQLTKRCQIAGNLNSSSKSSFPVDRLGIRAEKGIGDPCSLYKGVLRYRRDSIPAESMSGLFPSSWSIYFIDLGTGMVSK